MLCHACPFLSFNTLANGGTLYYKTWNNSFIFIACFCLYSLHFIASLYPCTGPVMSLAGYSWAYLHFNFK
jgi:hypothetical protein